jgi:DNA-binding CsgD family transcriptional regulator
MTLCGIVATCGRPLGHRGHHGGFRPLQPEHPPALPHLRGEVLGAPLAPREMLAIRTYARLGSQSESAHEMGISTQTMKNTLTHVYQKLGAGSAVEAMFIMGWIRIPTDHEVAVYDYDRRFGELQDELDDLIAQAKEAQAHVAEASDEFDALAE